MVFNSADFIKFFFFIVVIYFGVPHRYRWLLLLAASYFFYMVWNPVHVLLLLLLSAISYLSGLGMGRCRDRAGRRPYLILSVAGCLGTLVVFKYFNFFSETFQGLLDLWGSGGDPFLMRLSLPVGISFYSFQALSYTIDVYRGDREPERRPGIFALYVSFFPQLVAGPIERSTRLLPQLDREQRFDYDRTADGLRQMLWGYFKKVVIADTAAGIVDHVYSLPSSFSGPALAAATVLFAFQIYCDFAGYTDIAIGAARILGIELMTNFDRPYHAPSIAEFWRRWHISLSTWFRDYLYVPLGGNRVTRWRWYFNLLFVFVVSGLWHGANWTFVAWGLLHGSYFVAGIMTKGARERVSRVLGLHRFPRLTRAGSAAVTFAFVCFAWIFFRARNIHEAWLIVSRLFQGWGELLSRGGFWELVHPLYRYDFLIAALSIAAMETVHLLQARFDLKRAFLALPIYLRWAAYYAVLYAIFMFGKFDQKAFIYFQF